MVNKRITWTTESSAKKMIELLSGIDVAQKDLVENELKCHLRSYKTSAGDTIIWNEPFFTDDKVAFEKGSKFLQGWCDFAFLGGSVSKKEDFADYWKMFIQSEKIDSDSNFHKRTVQFRALVAKDAELGDSANEGDTSQRANNFLESWVRSVLLLSDYKAGGNPSNYQLQEYSQLEEGDIQRVGRLIISGISKDICSIPFSVTAIHNLCAAIHLDPAVELAERELNCAIEWKYLERGETFDGVETVQFKLTPRNTGDVTAVKRTSLFLFSWIGIASRDYKYSLSRHRKEWAASYGIKIDPGSQPTVTEPQSAPVVAELVNSSSVDDSTTQTRVGTDELSTNQPPNAQAPDDDWEKYSSAFKATEVDRLMIEETAKVCLPL